MKKAIVVGTGAGGATVAKELQGAFDVTIFEAGGEFHPFSLNLSAVDLAKRSGLLFDERETSLLFPAMNVMKTREKTVLVRGIGVGGTTTIATGNGLRVDGALKSLGIDLDVEFQELRNEIPISTEHRGRWHRATRQLFSICQDLGLNPEPMPKMGDAQRCINCGRCIFGCPQGAKWDSRRFVREAQRKGAELRTKSPVENVVIRGGEAAGVNVRKGLRTKFEPADIVILAAGGFGTPAILENSGIKCQDRLFVDPVLCIAAEWKGCLQNREISMPFVVNGDGFILSPYFDFLSYFYRKDWHYPAEDTAVMMVKIADTCKGTVTGKGVEKTLTEEDRKKLAEGAEICRRIFRRTGASDEAMALGTVNAGHPGGTVPLSKNDVGSLHPSTLPGNLYVADASLFPESLGNPPILTIMALAKGVAKSCLRDHR